MPVIVLLSLSILSQTTASDKAATATPAKVSPHFAKPSPIASSAPTSAEPPIFKVLVWYDRDRPLDTFKYQEYDLRKHEFTREVESWVGKVRNDYPRYAVIVRDVDPSREPGDTEKLKVGSVIKRELTIAAALAGIAIGGSTGPQPIPLGSGAATQPRAAPSSSIHTDRGFLAPSSSTFPVPIPYPRPHP